MDSNDFNSRRLLAVSALLQMVCSGIAFLGVFYALRLLLPAKLVWVVSGVLVGSVTIVWVVATALVRRAMPRQPSFRVGTFCCPHCTKPISPELAAKPVDDCPWCGMQYRNHHGPDSNPRIDCPHCHRALHAGSLRAGTNLCPYCRREFIAE